MLKHLHRIVFVILLLTTGAASAQPGIQKGVQLFEEGKLSEAKSFFDDYIASNEDDARAYFYMGRIYFEEEDFGEASDHFDQAAELDSDNSTYYMWLGHAFGRRAQEASRIRQPFLANSCRKNYEKAVELAPDNVEVRESLIEFYMQAPGIMGGGRDKAEEQVNTIFGIDSLSGYMARARLHTYYEETGQALQSYYEAVEQFPEAMPPYFQLYNHFFNQQDFKSAADIARKQLSENDATTAIYINLGNAQQRIDQFDAALANYERALDLDSTAYSAWYQIGRLAAVLGTHLETGEEHLLQFIALEEKLNEETLAWSHFRLGTVYEHQGKNEKAREHYERALEQYPEHQEARAALEGLK